MTLKHFSNLFIVALITSGCISFSNLLQDASLLPRVFAVALTLILSIPLFWSYRFTEKIQIDFVDIAFFSYFLLHAVSIFQAINKPEAIFETGKIFLSFFSYLVFKIFLAKGTINESVIYKTILFIVAVYLFYAFSQLSAVSETSKLEGDNLYNITGLSGNKNLLSGIMMMTAFLLATYSLNASKILKIISITAILIQIILILILQTRSVFLALVSAVIIILAGIVIIKGKTSVKLLFRIGLGALVVISGTVIFIIVSGTAESFLSRLDVSNYKNSDTGIERIVVWYKSFFMLKDHWLLGVGARNWMLAFPDYSLKGMFRLMYLNMVFLQPHNDLLWIWCELGITGLLSFLSIFILLIYAAIRAIIGSTIEKDRIILLILIGLQFAFLIFCFFDFPKERMEHQLILSLSWAIMSLKGRQNMKLLAINTRYVRILFLFAVAFLIFMTILTGIRMKGDLLMRPMLAAKERKDSQSVMLISQKMYYPLATLDPLSVPKKWHEGVAAYELGKFDIAYECFRQAHRQSPYNHHVLNNLGGMEAYYKRYDNALKYFTESLRINERNDDTRFNMAFTLYQVQRYDEALLVLDMVWSDLSRKQEFIEIINNGKQKNHQIH